MQTLSDPDSIAKYQALVLRKALETYMLYGVRVNTQYTPMKMMATAARITGKRFKPRAYASAIKALDEFLKSE